MKIVADENIPFVREAFSHLGKVKTFPGRKINRKFLREADVLLVRSVTKVNAFLLEGSRIKFVATATIGYEHIDSKYLKERSIGFFCATGSNADSVKEYFFVGLFFLARKKGFYLKGKTLGVVGVGNIGKRVVSCARALGMKVLENDPPRARKERKAHFRVLDQLMEADIITLHVPLTYQGKDATYHLFDAERITKMKADSIVVNTSRGGVVDDEALKKALFKRTIGGAVLDVWEGEPEIDVNLLKMVDIGTPHIAGYSFDGKINGTRMIYHAVCNFFNIKPTWDPSRLMPSVEVPHLRIEVTDDEEEEVIQRTIRQIYDIEVDDNSLREILNCEERKRGSFFDRLRHQYRHRREFFSTNLKFSRECRVLKEKFIALGFSVKN